jgi:hypothetical protein
LLFAYLYYCWLSCSSFPFLLLYFFFFSFPDCRAEEAMLRTTSPNSRPPNDSNVLFHTRLRIKLLSTDCNLAESVQHSTGDHREL